jgi:hypothetical protein
MPRVEFEPTIPVFERPKKVRASDRAATGTGKESKYDRKKKRLCLFPLPSVSLFNLILLRGAM